MEDKPEGLVKVTSYDDLIKAIKKKAAETRTTNYRIAKEGKIPQTTVERMMSEKKETESKTELKTETKFSSILGALNALGIEVYIKTKP